MYYVFCFGEDNFYLANYFSQCTNLRIYTNIQNE